MQNTIYSYIGDRIAERKKPLVVGINGAYTAGKTLFTEGLQEHLRQRGQKTQIIHYDDFHNPFDTMEWTEDTEIDAFYHRAFCPEKLVREVLAPFRERGRMDEVIDCVNLGTGQYTNRVHFDMDENTVVLLEGVLLFRAPLIEYLDYKIYLDIGEDVILERGRLRDAPRFGEAIMEKFVTRYIPVQQRYIREWNPAKAADLVIDNSDYRSPRIVRPRD